MSQSSFTCIPATVREYEGHEIHHKGLCVAVTCTQDPIEVSEEEERCAKFITAACNAFDSAATKLGLNASDLAECVANAGLAELLESLAGVADDLRHLVKRMDDVSHYQRSLRRAMSIIARVKGDAA